MSMASGSRQLVWISVSYLLVSPLNKLPNRRCPSFVRCYHFQALERKWMLHMLCSLKLGLVWEIRGWKDRFWPNCVLFHLKCLGDWLCFGSNSEPTEDGLELVLACGGISGISESGCTRRACAYWEGEGGSLLFRPGLTVFPFVQLDW